MIHIVFSDSAAGSVKYGLKDAVNVINLGDNLSQGPISNNIDYEMRQEWISTVSNDEERAEIEHFIKEGYDNFHNDLNQIKDDDEVCIWFGNNSYEKCGLMYFLTKLNRYENVSLINVSNVTLNEGEFNEYYPRAVGEIMPEKLNIIFNKEQHPLTQETFYKLTHYWISLVKENSTLRVFNNSKVISVPENYYDDAILKTTMKLSKDGYRKCARIIGEILGHSEDCVTDDYIFWRIKELIHKGKLLYNGDQRAMRYLELKHH